MTKYVCVHSHFYQPPRENPWLDQIEPQSSAAPFRDWNERISYECYRENGRSRIISNENYVVGFSNNYSKMSFNMGPTLLSWMEEFDPKTYKSVIEGDALSVNKFNGHGNAIAQCYNHIIMPLANRRDKETQVVWGIKDFEKRFHRYPEAMWLAETAVDTETLEVLALHKMKYVILAPRQASKIRRLSGGEWQDVSHEKINTTRAYSVNLPSGRKIAAYFYDGVIAKAVAFDGLLHNGETFAGRLLGAFAPNSSENQLVHIATDGESYGHHHKSGDMALAYALKTIEERSDVHLCNYGSFLEFQNPEYEVEIFQNSSWSCVHGIERWRSDCGCNSGSHSGWNQKWRGPLREAFDKLRDAINIYFESTLAKYNIDAWEARNDYVNVVLNRSEESNKQFIKKWMSHSLPHNEEIFFIKCFEIQRQLLLMYTSCGWFFDEVSGLETVQTMQYAFRAIDLAEDNWGKVFKEDFLKSLELVPSNIKEYSSARAVFDKYVKPSKISFQKITVHYAVISLFKDLSDMTHLYTFDIKKQKIEHTKLGNNKILYGFATVRSRITYSQKDILFTAVHLGENIIIAGVLDLRDQDEYMQFKKILDDYIVSADFTGIMKAMNEKFASHLYTLKDLLPEKRNYLIKDIISEKIEDIEQKYVQVYEDNCALVSFLNSLQIEIPSAFKVSFEHVLNEKIIEVFKTPIYNLNTQALEQYIQELNRSAFPLHKKEIQEYLQLRLTEFAEVIRDGRYDKLVLQNFLMVVKFARTEGLNIQWSEVQYIIYQWKTSFEHIPVEINELTHSIWDVVKIR